MQNGPLGNKKYGIAHRSHANAESQNPHQLKVNQGTDKRPPSRHPLQSSPSRPAHAAPKNSPALHPIRLRPGAWRPQTQVAAPALSGDYPLRLRQIAHRAANTGACLEVGGHTSRTGPEPLNQRLSLRRAEAIRRQLIELAPGLESRSIAAGAGSRENLVGTGRDDSSDALDRRVVFKVIECAGRG